MISKSSLRIGKDIINKSLHSLRTICGSQQSYLFFIIEPVINPIVQKVIIKNDFSKWFFHIMGGNKSKLFQFLILKFKFKRILFDLVFCNFTFSQIAGYFRKTYDIVVFVMYSSNYNATPKNTSILTYPYAFLGCFTSFGRPCHQAFR